MKQALVRQALQERTRAWPLNFTLLFERGLLRSAQVRQSIQHLHSASDAHKSASGDATKEW